MLKRAQKYNAFLLVGSLMVVALLLVAACGGDAEPAPAAPAIDEAALSNLVKSAVEEASMEQPEGLSAQQVQDIVNQAMMSSGDTQGLTAEQVQDIVDNALMSAEDPEALTAMQVQEIVAMALEEAAMQEERQKGTITFATLNWGTAEIQSALAQYMVQHGYGYPVDEKAGATIPLFQGLLGGDVDVTLEIWLPNQDDVWLPALDEGAVIPVGNSLNEQWQSAFVIPTHTAEANPGLRSVQDIRDHMDVFPQEDGKVILWTCPGDWGCHAVNASQVTAYGLDDIITLKPADGGAALFASLQGAYDKGEAWLGYLWGPTLPANTLNLTRLEEPPCGVGQAFGDGCPYGVGPVRIAVHPSMVQRAPEVIEMLRLWSFTDEQIGEALSYRDQTDASAQETAIWFLTNREAIWSSWVPTDVANRIKAALAAG